MDVEFPLMVFKVRIETDAAAGDFEYFEVATDQRDQRNGLMTAGIDFEGADKIGALRAIAWAGLVRTHQISMSWPEFHRVCTHAQPVVTGDGNGEVAEVVAVVRPTPAGGAD